MNHSIKFHIHMIWYEHFTRHGSQVVKQRPKNAKQQSKISIKWKMNQQFMQKFMVKLDIYKTQHAKFEMNWKSLGMSNKIMKLT